MADPVEDLFVDYHSLSANQRRKLRNRLAEAQGGLCFFCDEPLDGDPPKSVRAKKVNWDAFPPFFLKYPVHLQHCHDTGITEGAVHALCNAVWWQYHGR